MRQATELVRTRGPAARPALSRVCFRPKQAPANAPAVRQSKTLRSRLWRSSMRRPCMKPQNARNAARFRTRRVNFSVSVFQRPSARATTSCMCLRRTPALPCRSCSCCTAARRIPTTLRSARARINGPRARLAGCLSRADSTRERAPLLELVSPEPTSKQAARSQRSSPASSGRSSTSIRSMRDVSMSLACRQAARWLPSWRMNIPNCLPPPPSIRVCRWARHTTSDQRWH